MSEPLLSVVIPTHDRSNLVGRAIESALAQTLEEIEVIVVDDASTDDTPAVLAGYSDERLVSVRRETSGSAGAARNTGVQQARAALVSFLDDDDELLPRFAERVHGAFESAGPGTGLAWCGTETVEDGPDGERLISSGLWRPSFVDREAAHLSFLRSRRIGICGVTVRRDLFGRLAGFDERMRKAEDTDFLTRAVREVDFVVVGETLVRVHKHPGPNLTVYDRPMAEAYEVILEKNAATLAEQPDLAAALHYKTGWLHYHAGDRARAREHMRASLRARALAPKTWLAILLHEILGSPGRKLHAGVSRLLGRGLEKPGVGSPER